MKLPMFTEKESCVNHILSLINGYKLNIEREERNLTSAAYKESWCRMNNCVGNEEAWNNQLKWVKGNIASMKRKVKKMEKMIASI